MADAARFGRQEAGRPGRQEACRGLLARAFRHLPVPSAQVSTEAAVLCLEATLKPGGAAGVNRAVLAHLAESAQPAGTVILALDGDVNEGCLEALRPLDGALRARGIGLRLVMTTPGTAPGTGAPCPGAPAMSAGAASPPVHGSMRTAVLAVYAGLPGPGLVNAQVRAALSAPVEYLRLGDDG